MDAVISLINSVGFPIACCCMMGWYINTTMKEFRQTMENNNKLLSRICDRLDMWKHEKKEDD